MSPIATRKPNTMPGRRRGWRNLSPEERARRKAAWQAKQAAKPPVAMPAYQPTGKPFRPVIAVAPGQRPPTAAQVVATFKPAPWSQGRFGGNFTGATAGVRTAGAAADNPMQAGMTIHAAPASRMAAFNRGILGRTSPGGGFRATGGAVHGLDQDNFSTPEGDAAVEALMAQADQRAADFNAAGDAAYAKHESEVEAVFRTAPAGAPLTAVPTAPPTLTPPSSVSSAPAPAPASGPTPAQVAQVKNAVATVVQKFGTLASAAKVQAAQTQVKQAVANRNAAVANLAATQAAVERGRQTKQVLIVAAVVAGAILLLKG